MMENNISKTEVATLGGGCFWCLEAIFIDLKGVEKVVSGYAGGSNRNPTYQEVSRGASGHAEVVQVTYNPDEISYEDLLKIFFTIHDPTTLNRQAADVGPQYRSVIFYHNDSQRIMAEKVMTDVESRGIWNNPIVTQLKPFSEFFVAEEYHQEYFKRNPEQDYCQVVIAPKVVKFRKSFADRLKD
ncbi:MAG: peptide-methionine (S)-S-oxide reductase MsrA [Anaerolineales bacterium]|nr:peptide-methionine (S)-S-oxide reductase MsrA [Anaerolineales bacterium]